MPSASLPLVGSLEKEPAGWKVASFLIGGRRLVRASSFLLGLGFCDSVKSSWSSCSAPELSVTPRLQL